MCMFLKIATLLVVVIVQGNVAGSNCCIKFAYYEVPVKMSLNYNYILR